MLEKYKKDEMAPVELVSFRAKTKALLKATPHQADIIIATPYNTSQTIVYNLIFINEARSYLLTGDHYQLTPVVLSTPNTSSSQSIAESTRGTISKKVGS